MSCLQTATYASALTDVRGTGQTKTGGSELVSEAATGKEVTN